MTIDQTFWKSESTVTDRSVLHAGEHEQGATPIRNERKVVIKSWGNEANSLGVRHWEILSVKTHGITNVIGWARSVTRLSTLKRPLNWLKRDLTAMKKIRDVLLCYNRPMQEAACCGSILMKKIDTSLLSTSIRSMLFAYKQVRNCAGSSDLCRGFMQNSIATNKLPQTKAQSLSLTRGTKTVGKSFAHKGRSNPTRKRKTSLEGNQLRNLIIDNSICHTPVGCMVGPDYKILDVCSPSGDQRSEGRAQSVFRTPQPLESN